MKNTTLELQERFSKRLNILMDNTPGLDKLKKVSKASGVYYGTVRNVKTNKPIRTTAENLRNIAAAFGLTLAEFVAQESEAVELSQNEREIIKALRVLHPEDFAAFLRQITRFAAVHRAESLSTRITDDPGNKG